METLSYNVNTNDGLVRFLENPVFPNDVEVAKDLTVTGESTLTGAVTATAGVQSASVAAIATADGLTTGLIPSGTSFCTVTSDGATKVVVLPVGIPGNVIRITVLATGAELETLAAGSATINAVDCSGANSMAMAAASVYTLVCQASEVWVAYGWGADGAAEATILPN